MDFDELDLELERFLEIELFYRETCTYRSKGQTLLQNIGFLLLVEWPEED